MSSFHETIKCVIPVEELCSIVQNYLVVCQWFFKCQFTAIETCCYFNKTIECCSRHSTLLTKLLLKTPNTRVHFRCWYCYSNLGQSIYTQLIDINKKNGNLSCSGSYCTIGCLKAKLTYETTIPYRLLQYLDQVHSHS
jgi:hypothetical protein